MFFKNRFLYNDNASDGGGTGGGEAAQTVVQQPVLTAEDLKELGFDSVDSLKESLRKQKEASIPDEQKQKQEQLDRANLIKYATENDLARPDDFTQYETLKAKADKDLVFEKFANEFKEDNPEIEEDKLDEAIKEAFESEYRLSSQNEKAKSRGLDRIKKEASELRSPVESKITKAQTEYNSEKELKSKYPAYEKFFNDVVKEATPEKLVLLKQKEGEEEISIEVELTEDDKKAINEKFFKNSKTFYDFAHGKPEEVKAKLTQKINSFIKERKMEEGLRKTWEVAKGVGTKGGSNVGATNPFPLAQSGAGSQAPVVDIQDSNKKIANARNEYRNNR